MRPLRRRLGTRPIGFAAALSLAVCASACTPAVTPPGVSPSPSAAAGSEGPITVTAGFYPLAYLAEQIGGSRVTVTTLTKPGVEPHDVELSPQEVAGLTQARLVVTLAGVAPAVDAAVAHQAPATTLDVSSAASLDLVDPGGEGRVPGDGGGASGTDPHFWLDPIRYAAVGRAVAQRLAALDPEGAAGYGERAAVFEATMTSLDAAYRQGLASCASTTLVTSHAAFGYLARRYQLTQVPIAGLSPDQEPSAQKLAEVGRIVRDTGVRTIYAETLGDSAFARTVASSTGASLAVLDPVEGITTASAGPDYRAVMLANLATLRVGQECR